MDSTDQPTATPAELAELQALDAAIKASLPPQYETCYEAVPPNSMGSAGLQFNSEGKVAWDEIWTSFCDLAMAGGPPHRGTLLEPALEEEVSAEPEKYQEVVEEIGRGLWLTTGMHVLPRVAPGWVGVVCRNEQMSSWLVRAIVAENVSARHQQHMLHLPAGPNYRLPKEVKNVVVALAKAHHYWTYHMPDRERAVCTPTIVGPATAAQASAEADTHRKVVDQTEQGIRNATGLVTAPSPYPGWIAIPCTDVAMAVWLMRAVSVENILVRREEDVLYVPATPVAEEQWQKVVEAVRRACRLWGIHSRVQEK